MTNNPYDQSARYAAHQLDEGGFLRWLLPRVTVHYRFERWLNTRNTPFPGEPERICDTVAAWIHEEGTEPPVATVIEFLSEPSHVFLQRMAAYTLDVRTDHPFQATDPPVQYETIGVVVVLTGTKQAETWVSQPAQAEGAGHTFTAVVRKLATQSAAQTLTRIDQGELSRCVLPWRVLMQGGDDSGTITEWKRGRGTGCTQACGLCGLVVGVRGVGETA